MDELVSAGLPISSLATAVRHAHAVFGRLSGQGESAYEFKKVRAILRKKLRLGPTEVGKVVASISRASNDQELAATVDQALRGMSGINAVAALAASAVLEIRKTRQQQAQIQSKLDAMLRLQAPEHVIDCYVALSLAQRTDSRLVTCFEQVPLRALFVAPRLSAEFDCLTGDRWNKLDLSGDRAIAVSGSYGVGKSTLLKMIATDLSDASMAPLLRPEERRVPLPVYLPAHRIVGKAKSGILAAINLVIEEMYEVNVGLVLRNEHYFPVLLIDGFDEIPSPDKAEELLEACCQLADDVEGNARVVFGGRDYFFRGAQASELFEQFSVRLLNVCRFKEDDQNTWIRRWNALASDLSLSSLSSRDLWDANKARRSIYQTPLLMLLHAVAKAPGLRFRNEQDLYKHIIDITIPGKPLVRSAAGLPVRGVVDRASAMGVLRGEDQLKRRLLQEVAYVALKSGGAYAPEQEVVQALGRVPHSELWGLAVTEEGRALKKRSPKFLLRAVHVAHFFSGDVPGFQFVHESFVQYLAAERYLRSLDKEDADSAQYLRPLGELFVCMIAIQRQQKLPVLSKKILARLEKADAVSSLDVAILGRSLRLCQEEDILRCIDLREVIIQKIDQGLREETSLDMRRVVAALSTLAAQGSVFKNLNKAKAIVQKPLWGRFVGATIENVVVESPIARHDRPLVFRDCRINGLALRNFASCVVRFVRCRIENLEVSHYDGELHLAGSTLRTCRFVDSNISFRVYNEPEMERCAFKDSLVDGDYAGISYVHCKAAGVQPVGFEAIIDRSSLGKRAAAIIENSFVDDVDSSVVGLGASFGGEIEPDEGESEDLLLWENEIELRKRGYLRNRDSEDDE